MSQEFDMHEKSVGGLITPGSDQDRHWPIGKVFRFGMVKSNPDGWKKPHRLLSRSGMPCPYSTYAPFTLVERVN